MCLCMAMPRACAWCSHGHVHGIARGLSTARVYYWQTCLQETTHGRWQSPPTPKIPPRKTPTPKIRPPRGTEKALELQLPGGGVLQEEPLPPRRRLHVPLGEERVWVEVQGQLSDGQCKFPYNSAGYCTLHVSFANFNVIKFTPQDCQHTVRLCTARKEKTKDGFVTGPCACVEKRQWATRYKNAFRLLLLFNSSGRGVCVIKETGCKWVRMSFIPNVSSA